jgi:hypothetical protein
MTQNKKVQPGTRKHQEERTELARYQNEILCEEGTDW